MSDITTAGHPPIRDTARPPDGEAISPSERVMLQEFDTQRRLNLLRIILPALFVLAALAIPFALLSDFQSGGFQSSLQLNAGLVPFAIGLWATWVRRVNLASTMLFVGVSAVIVLLLLQTGPLRGFIDYTSIIPFSLLALPIAIAGIFGAPRYVAFATAGSALFTLGLLLLTPPDPTLAQAMHSGTGLSVFTIPLAVQGALGVLMFAANRSFRRLQRELGDVHVAYAREKELDRLKDQFIASVNHELRTPIMAMQGYLELARELGARSDFARQEQMLRRGTEAAEHLASIVRSVLGVRALEVDTAALAPTTFPLHPAVVNATQLLSPTEAGNEPRALHLRVPSDLLVHADEQKVRQVVLNLLSNATKYSPPGSPIEITARIVAPAAPTGKRRGGEKAGAMVEVAVRDQGLGIPPDQAVLLFQRFVRLERDIASSVTGTGLGLALCRSYVEAMGGRIWVESSGVSGEGATFYFTLPLGQPDAVQTRRGGPAGLRGRTVPPQGRRASSAPHAGHGGAPTAGHFDATPTPREAGSPKQPPAEPALSARKRPQQSEARR